MSIYELVAARSWEYGHRVQDVVGPNKARALVATRQKIAIELFDGHDLTYGQIGKALGGRHHTTILWLLRGGRHK